MRIWAVRKYNINGVVREFQGDVGYYANSADAYQRQSDEYQRTFTDKSKFDVVTLFVQGEPQPENEAGPVSEKDLWAILSFEPTTNKAFMPMECSFCKALVFDTTEHANWHKKQRKEAEDAKTTFTNRINNLSISFVDHDHVISNATVSKPVYTKKSTSNYDHNN